ncbi:hypothetical protein K2173_021303 [Erythroxylum novogranatense]|uniref:Uncharacterized protein n=1 Tax=Erythroxylum novogranatense TaxID=1862640 RepID=A0AAV8TVY7_9ROSI|nr:hypothetical protein K2173_021303 [Erythroxylum novogranatense]
MPTFTAVALDRLLEPAASKSFVKNPPPKANTLPTTDPVTNSGLERQNSISNIDRRVNRPQLTPALYATPEATPVPYSPSSFTPSPYIVNHKRRGPHLLKSFSQDDMTLQGKPLNKDDIIVDSKNAGIIAVESTVGPFVAFTTDTYGVPTKGVDGDSVLGEPANGVHLAEENDKSASHDIETGSSNGKTLSSDVEYCLALEKDVTGHDEFERDSETEEFYDLQESMSYTGNTDGEENSGAESSLKLIDLTPTGESFDAQEEVSPEAGLRLSLSGIEAELRGIRFNLLVETERRKQSEEALHNTQNHWERVREQLSLVGLTVPAVPTSSADTEQTYPVEHLCQQVHLARFISETVGRGIARAEMEMEMEAQIEVKNFEIARLSDRLQYYEAVNREMSQRNQEAIDMARRNRQLKKRRRRWVWGSIAAAVTLGTAALAWSFLPAGEGLSSGSDSEAPEHKNAASEQL